MTKSDLISTIADAAGCSKGAAEAAYNRLIDKIASTITAEGEADIRGLGSFKRERTEAREGRNPRTGEKIQIAAPDTGSSSSPRRRCANGFRLRSKQKRPNRPEYSGQLSIAAHGDTLGD